MPRFTPATWPVVADTYVSSRSEGAVALCDHGACGIAVRRRNHSERVPEIIECGCQSDHRRYLDSELVVAFGQVPDVRVHLDDDARGQARRPLRIGRSRAVNRP